MKKLIIILAILLCAGSAMALKLPLYFTTYISQTTSGSTYWTTARTDYWTDARTSLWTTARNTEVP